MNINHEVMILSEDSTPCFFSKRYQVYAATTFHTWPASISVWNFLAATPDVVKIAAPLPYLQKQDDISIGH